MDKSMLLGSFEQAIQRLSEALATPAKGDLEKAGCIQYFDKNIMTASENMNKK